MVDEPIRGASTRNYYLKRPIVAQLGLGATLPEDAAYPLNIGDETGRPLDGTSD